MRGTPLISVLKSARELRNVSVQQTVQHLAIDGNKLDIFSVPHNKVYISSPTGELFHSDNTFVRGIVGPYGSGKSVLCSAEIVKRAAAMPVWTSTNRRRSRWAIVRNTSGELHSTTLATWTAWFNDLGDIKKHQKPILTYEHTFNDGHGIVELELLFLALDREDDVRKLKSLELTGAWFNELSEIPQGAIAHMRGRVGRYPGVSFCPQPYWSGIIADSNPCPDDHWMYKAFVEQRSKDMVLFRQPPGLIKNENDEWVRNPDADNAKHLPQDYYEKLASGQSNEFIKVFCLGEWGAVGFGKKVYPEYNDDLHSVDDVEAIQGDPIHLGWDFGLCYSDDTEVLTKDGWKLFKDVDTSLDTVATRNPDTGRMEYTKINFKTEFEWDGDLYEWASTEVNFLVTPEHIVPFTYRDTPNKVHFKSAQWLAEHHSGHHYVDLCSDWQPEFYFDENYFGMNAHQFCEFMGLYLSEGSTDGNRISIYQNKQNPIMQKILDNTGKRWTYNGSAWRIRYPELAGYLKGFGLAHHKRVPAQIKGMPKEQIMAFIYAYTMGDGHIRIRPNGAVEHTLFTVSKDMADDFQELAQKSGWNSSLRRTKPQTSTIIEDDKTREIYSDGGYSITFKKRAKRAELLARNFKKIQYKGKIYCLNVPYHTLYVRRNGKPSWNGNTPACIVVQISERGQFRILKEYTADGMGIRTFAESVVLPGLTRDFPYCKIGESEADPSGIARSQIMEELSCIGDLNALGITTRGASTNDLTPRIGSVRYFLNTMIDGKPAFLLSRKGCPTLRRGFTKDYCFSRIAVAGEERYRDKPDKNMSSHPHDGLQYIAMKFAADRIIEAKTDKSMRVDMYNPVLRLF